MAITSVLRLNLTGDPLQPETARERYLAAIEMAVFAEENGFDTVNLEEHHCAENGWLPSPLTLAAAIASRTKRIRINVSALLATLYDPLRLAEDIAVLDLISEGRFSFVTGLGYRPLEYHAMDKDWDARGAAMDELVVALLNAWRGEPFEYKGKTVCIRPVPASKPHPFFMIGGMSKAAARRAAKFGLPFAPPQPMPELEDYYYQQLKKYGQSGFVYAMTEDQNRMLFLHEDPESAWQQFGPYLLNETREYARWKQAGVQRPSEQDTHTIDDLKAQRRFEILTVAQLQERINVAGGDYFAVHHPLAGGVPLEDAWRSLKTYAEHFTKD